MMEIPTLDDDGLLTPEIGPWGIEKYKLVALYSSVFIRSMRGKWESLVYIDLFSGSGRSRIRGTNRIISASPMVVLNLKDKFNVYIFCERDEEKYNALNERIKREHPNHIVNLVNGDANLKIEQLLCLIPQYSNTFRVLSFCFIDPWSLGNLKFSTIETLSKNKMDFLVLIPSGMDAARNIERYITAESTKLDDFLGRTDWRETWGGEELKGVSFESFVVKEFSKSMNRIGFIDPGLESSATIYSDDRNLLLYRLMLYSKNKLGNKFWNEIKKSIDPQRKIVFPAE